MGGVSLFDFAAADWEWIFENNQQHYWLPFLKAPTSVKSADKWIATVWLGFDRTRLPGLLSLLETARAWPSAGHKKWMPKLEACHKGPMPLAACNTALAVCAAEPRRYQAIAVDPFDLVALGKLEAQWRAEFAPRYEGRGVDPLQWLLRGLQNGPDEPAKR